jgi:hypothetical protein
LHFGAAANVEADGQIGANCFGSVYVVQVVDDKGVGLELEPLLWQRRLTQGWIEYNTLPDRLELAVYLGIDCFDIYILAIHGDSVCNNERLVQHQAQNAAHSYEMGTRFDN